MTNFFSSILTWIYGIIPSYGWAIVVFTLLIRLVLLPLDIKSKKSMRAMAKIQPKQQELQKKYGKDKEKLNQKMQELYKKEKVNPLAGCLPLLIQLPLLFIMFAAMRQVSSDIMGDKLFALFNQMSEIGVASEVPLVNLDSFLWIKNVFQPDSFSSSILPAYDAAVQAVKDAGNVMPEAANLREIYTEYVAMNYGANMFKSIPIIFSWKLTVPTSWSAFINYANGLFILPILAAASQIIMTKLQPKQQTAPNPNGSPNPMGGNFMKWFFPLLSLYFCASYTAAFAVYWVAANIIQLAQQLTINKYFDRKDQLAAAAESAEM